MAIGSFIIKPLGGDKVEYLTADKFVPLDTIISEVHRAYVSTTSESAKQRLDAQIKALQTVKDAIKNAICDIVQEGEEYEHY